MRRSQALSLNTLVLASLGVMVLLISAITFSSGIGKSNNRINAKLSSVNSCFDALQILRAYDFSLQIDTTNYDKNNEDKCAQVRDAYSFACEHHCQANLVSTDWKDLKVVYLLFSGKKEIEYFNCGNINRFNCNVINNPAGVYVDLDGNTPAQNTIISGLSWE